jgi:hypothetical protein
LTARARGKNVLSTLPLTGPIQYDFAHCQSPLARRFVPKWRAFGSIRLSEG